MFLRLKTSDVLLLHDMSNMRVEGHSDLLKNLSTGGVINTDKTAYQRYMQAKSNTMNIHTAVSDINNLKEEVSEIKRSLTLITELLKQKNGN